MNLEIISLIYKSVDYLNLIVNELKKDYCKVDGWDVNFRIVANDATEPVLNKLKELGINYSVYNDPKPNDYYLNRVYRCWNFAGKTSKYDNICFINSDMIFSDGWLENLLKHYDGINIPCSRLVESGKLLSGQHAISKDFGRSPKDIKYNDWYMYATSIKEDKVMRGGLYMPCIFSKIRFVESNMYPEGNIYSDGRPGSMVGDVIMSGDYFYFYKVLEKRYNMKHITVFDSLSFHIQTGELDS